jgi:LysM repeat protein
VQPGDTLFGLSRTTGVPVAEIARANGIPPDSQLRVGQRLQIPSGRPASGSAIRVSSPNSGATVRSPIVVQGTAAVFEGVVNVEVLSADGETLARTSTTANQPDAGQPGPFRAEIALPPLGSERPVVVRVFWRSPRDGTPMDEVRIPVTVVG